MENGDIPDESIQASSHIDDKWAPAGGRLNGDSSWTAVDGEEEEWIQANIGTCNIICTR